MKKLAFAAAVLITAGWALDAADYATQHGPLNSKAAGR